MRMSTSSLSKLGGEVINHLSTDIIRMEYVVFFLPYFVIVFMQAIIVIVIFLNQIGPTFLAGFIIIISSFFLKTFISRVAFNKVK